MPTLFIGAIPFDRTRPIYIGRIDTDDVQKEIDDLRKEVRKMKHNIEVVSRAPDGSSAAVRVY